YSLCSERSIGLLRSEGRISLIVPLSMFSTPNMRSAQELMLERSRSLWVSYYSNRPAQLFEGAQNFLSIFISHKKTDGEQGSSQNCILNTTKLYRWAATERPTLFALHHFTNIDRTIKFPNYAFPKFANPIENKI